MQRGVRVQKFLTISRLQILYQSIGHVQHVRKLLTDTLRRDDFLLFDVKNVLEQLLENQYEQIYAANNPSSVGTVEGSAWCM